MSPEPYGRSRGAGPELRIGDDEREAAVRALGEHFAEGRLTKDEYDERSDKAWAARTRSALMPLFADLPRPEGAGRPVTEEGRRNRPGPDGPGWWFSARMVPVLVVVVALVVLTHLPVFLLLVVGWVLLAKSGRRGPHHQWHGGPRHGGVR
jgi:hypothetical protein